MRVIGFLFGFSLAVSGIVMWTNFSYYLSLESVWYRPLDLLCWLVVVGSVAVMDAN